jgi:very-short-patch-repair endonuclease
VPATQRPEQTRARFLDLFGNQDVPYRAALDAGFTPGSLRAARTRGLISSPRRGFLAAITSDEPVDDAGRGERTRRTLRLALAGVDDRAVISHASAAALYGIDTPGPTTPDVVELTLPGAANYDGPGLRVRGTGLLPHERTVVDGLACTTLARTAIDLARSQRNLGAALIPIDSAARRLIQQRTGTAGNELRVAVLDPAERSRAIGLLVDGLTGCYGWPGTVLARAAVEHADPASESALESRSRGWFLDAKLGDLRPGQPIRCDRTTYWADFSDPARRVIGEADGWSKYGVTPEEFRAALDGERARQRRLEQAGWTVVRWSAGERRAVVVARMSAALAHA